MDVLGAVVLEALEAGGLEDQQRLGQHRPLAPGAAGEQLEVAPAGRHRRLDPAAEGGEVLAAEVAAVLLVVAGDPRGDLALVEDSAGGFEAGDAVAGGGSLGL